MFKNLKIGVRLVAGFLITAALAALVGGIGISKIHQIDDADTRLYEKATVPLGDLNIIGYVPFNCGKYSNLLTFSS